MDHAYDKTIKRAQVLDPIQRVSEVAFGTLMALFFSGALLINIIIALGG